MRGNFLIDRVDVICFYSQLRWFDSCTYWISDQVRSCAIATYQSHGFVSLQDFEPQTFDEEFNPLIQINEKYSRLEIR